jgi:hypothetical protein
MIMGSFDDYLPHTAHDHEDRFRGGRAGRVAARTSRENCDKSPAGGAARTIVDIYPPDFRGLACIS